VNAIAIWTQNSNSTAVMGYCRPRGSVAIVVSVEALEENYPLLCRTHDSLNHGMIELLTVGLGESGVKCKSGPPIVSHMYTLWA